MPTSPLMIEVLGPLRVFRGDAEISLPGPNPSALLGMLLLSEGGCLPRNRAIDRFWGDRPEAKAAASFRQTLHGLREALGPDGSRIASTGSALRMDLESVEIDLHLLRNTHLPRPARLAALARRDLLEGLVVRSPGVEDWLRERRAAWRAEAEGYLRAALGRSEPASADARELAEALLALDPYDEDALLSLMKADAAKGDLRAMQGRFSAFAAGLVSDLGVGPTDELVAAYRGLSARPMTSRMMDAEIALDFPNRREASGIYGVARNVLIEELGRSGIRLRVAESRGQLVPIATLRGEIASFPGQDTLLLELAGPQQNIILTGRLAVTFPVNLDLLERRIVAEARRIVLALGVSAKDGAGLSSTGWNSAALGLFLAGSESLAGTIGTDDEPQDPAEPPAPSHAGAGLPVGPVSAEFGPRLAASSVSVAMPDEARDLPPVWDASEAALEPWPSDIVAEEPATGSRITAERPIPEVSLPSLDLEPMSVQTVLALEWPEPQFMFRMQAGETEERPNADEGVTEAEKATTEASRITGSDLVAEYPLEPTGYPPEKYPEPSAPVADLPAFAESDSFVFDIAV